MMANGMFPHFLGLLSKSPMPGNMQSDIPHPFRPSAPVLRRPVNPLRPSRPVSPTPKPPMGGRKLF